MDMIANAIRDLMAMITSSTAVVVRGASDISKDWLVAYKDRTKADRERTGLLNKLTDGGTSVPVVIAQVDTKSIGRQP